jgi:hypothetical protein
MFSYGQRLWKQPNRGSIGECLSNSAAEELSGTSIRSRPNLSWNSVNPHRADEFTGFKLSDRAGRAIAT